MSCGWSKTYGYKRGVKRPFVQGTCGGGRGGSILSGLALLPLSIHHDRIPGKTQPWRREIHPLSTSTDSCPLSNNSFFTRSHCKEWLGHWTFTVNAVRDGTWICRNFTSHKIVPFAHIIAFQTDSFQLQKLIPSMDIWWDGPSETNPFNPITLTLLIARNNFFAI